MPITINGGSTTNYWQGWGTFQNPSAFATQYTSTSGGTTVVSTVKDVSKSEITTLNAAINNTVFSNYPILSFTNLSPTICDTSAFPNVVSLQTGVSKVNLLTGNGALQIQLNCNTNATDATAYLSNYTNGSLAKSINTLVLSAVGANTAPAASFMNLYLSGNTLNINLYTKNIIDLSPFAQLSGSVCLVSPRHITSCDHWHPSVGNQVTFRDKDGVAQTKTITAISNAGNASDIWIGYLDSAVTGITPYSVLPPNATTTVKLPLASQNTNAYTPMPQGVYGFVAKQRNPFGGGDYIRQMQLGVIGNIAGSMNSITCYNGAGVLTQQGTKAAYPQITNTSDLRYPYKDWFTLVTGGDSGSPTFLPTGLTTATGTPLTILLGHQSTASTSSSLSYYATQINTAMNAMKAGGDTTVYALDVINVSQSAWWNTFTTY